MAQLVEEKNLVMMQQMFDLKPNEEHRKHPRVFARSMFPKATEVVFRVMGFKTEQKATLHSISQSGVFLQSQRIPSVGTEINLTFPFGNRRVACQGRVIYHSVGEDSMTTQGFGVKFTRMTTDDYMSIKSAVEECTQALRM